MKHEQPAVQESLNRYAQESCQIFVTVLSPAKYLFGSHLVVIS